MLWSRTLPRKRSPNSIYWRLPETARPEFPKLSPAEQAAAVARDVARFRDSLEKLRASREARLPPQERRLLALERRMDAVELTLAELVATLIGSEG